MSANQPSSKPIYPLTQTAFQPFGDVIEALPNSDIRLINDGHTQRFHDLANIDVNKSHGRCSVNIFRSTPLDLPLELRIMERHPLASQAFMPLGTQPYLVVVAPPGEFNEEQVRIFLATAHQGVNYLAGTWHHYSLALGETSDFLVIDRVASDEKDSAHNCEEISLAVPIRLSASAIQSALTDLMEAT